jgi:hypothetical protein
MRRSRKQEQFLQRAKLLFAEAGLLKNLAKGSRWQCTGMHCDEGLPSIGMAKNFVAPTLSDFYESGAHQSCADLTGGVWHREFRPERSTTSFRQERFRPASASLRPTLQSILERQRWLLRYPGREWSGRESECGRNSNPEIRVRLWAQEGRSNA